MLLVSCQPSPQLIMHELDHLSSSIHDDYDTILNIAFYDTQLHRNKQSDDGLIQNVRTEEFYISGTNFYLHTMNFVNLCSLLLYCHMVFLQQNVHENHFCLKYCAFAKKWQLQ